MRLAVNPNRMELLKLKKRLSLAHRGHDLLKDKLDELMRRFLNFVKEAEDLEKFVRPRLKDVFQHFLFVRGSVGLERLTRAIHLVEADTALEVRLVRILNVSVPNLDFKQADLLLKYNFSVTPAELDIALFKLLKLFPKLIKLTEVLKICQLLSSEIERTRRRVNALEYIMIPNIQETIRFIQGKLDEMERANLMRLMRVKEIVRSH